MSVLWTSRPKAALAYFVLKDRPPKAAFSIVGYYINNVTEPGEFTERAKKMVKLFNVNPSRTVCESSHQI
jgi:hypothetical protein